MRFRFRAREGRAEARTAYCVGMGGRSGDGMGSTRGTRPVPGDAPGGRRGGFLSRVPRVRRRSVRRAPSRARRGDRGRRPRARTARGRALARATREGAARDPGRRGRTRASATPSTRGAARRSRIPAERGRDGERAARARSLRRGAEPASRGAGHDARRTDRAPGSRYARVLQQNRPSRRSSAPRDRDGRGAESPERARERRDRRSARGSRDSAGASARRGTRARTSASGPDETADSAELSVSDALRRLSRVQLMPGTKLQLEHPA